MNISTFLGAGDAKINTLHTKTKSGIFFDKKEWSVKNLHLQKLNAFSVLSGVMEFYS